MPRVIRRAKTTPRVKDGRVQRKNHRDVHHVDSMSMPYRGVVVRGETYAEHWAHRCAAGIWDQTLAMLRG